MSNLAAHKITTGPQRVERYQGMYSMEYDEQQECEENNISATRDKLKFCRLQCTESKQNSIRKIIDSYFEVRSTGKKRNC
jgi:hypothetical protein